jgi:hypothetical protein
MLGRLARRHSGSRTWLERMRQGLSERTAQNLLVLFAMGLLAASVLWSLSRGGVLSLILAAAFVLVLLAISRAGGMSLYLLSGLAIAVAWISYLGWEPVMARLDTLQDLSRGPSETWRVMMFKDAARMGLGAPFLGMGAGTFTSVYPVWRTLPTSALATSPHNEYLHLWAEMGVPGVLLLLTAIGIFAWSTVRGLLRSSNAWAQGFLMGGVGAVVAVALHSVVDFPLRSPGIAATLAVVLALLLRVAQMEPEREEGPDAETEANEGSSRRRRRKVRRVKTLHHTFERWQGEGGSGRHGMATSGIVALVVLALAWLMACNMALDPLRGELLHRRVRRLQAQAGEMVGHVDVRALLDTIEASAMNSVPEHAGLYDDMADLASATAVATADDHEKLALAYRSLQLRKIAARLEPLGRRHYQKLVTHYLAFRKPELAARQAERVFELVPRDPWAWSRVAYQFGRHGETERAREYLQRARTMAEKHGMLEAAERKLAWAERQIEKRADQ